MKLNVLNMNIEITQPYPIRPGNPASVFIYIMLLLYHV